MPRPRFSFSDDPAKADFRAVHEYLSRRSYWAQGRSSARQRRAMRHSLCVGLYEGKRQAAFARVVTDYAVFAYICDLFVLEPYRGKGLGKRLMREILRHPRLKSVRLWTLFTKDAHGLYRKFGFGKLTQPRRMMALGRPCPR